MDVHHQPVLLLEVIEQLQPASGGIYVDGNLGFGGHSAAILECSAPDGKVVGFDLDPDALKYARQRLAPFGRRIRFVRGNFAAMAAVLQDMGIREVQGILLDLGLSSFQLDASGRGFSFQGDEPLDMRMDPSQSTTAADLVNTLSRDELADIFYFYGEERQARRIASCIVEERQHTPFRSTGQLAGVIERAVPRRFHPSKIHMATRSFQALRIAVNNEMDNLARVLASGTSLLAPGGRFCVISFHSLEDRLVKNSFKEQRELQVLTRKPIVPTAREVGQNPRARSAKLRVAERR